ncbi:Folylpolyglutamate synthase [Ceratocystis platani]|uniref:Folylpolyglutamate synthase n=1 Tax=Ceratocystis fimbriata f. sp. platani TaxID=88771 RepID=A0A0F8BJ72_CERFI|nr:Folylpolyglutamate synthase [Ceratocystis platani]
MDAIETLNSLQSSNAVVEARKKAGIKPNQVSIKDMHGYLARLGHSLADLNRLNIVHVAGTKGKGSTCAYVDSILASWQRVHGTPRRTGLLISPHLISVRERIQLNSQPISETLFTHYFFDVWEKLRQPETETIQMDSSATAERPSYARYLTLMAYHIFLEEGVDVAVIETGIGGEFDSTNLASKPAATGISMLGIDHVFVLGDTVEKIAWHKAGIMKTGSPAFSVPQVPAAEKVLQDRAREKAVGLQFVGLDSRLEGIEIKPDADFQKSNASLAIKLAETVLQKVDPEFAVKTASTTALPSEFIDGLQSMVWKGRCQIKTEGKVTWHLDGAHTIDSIKVCSHWFAQECGKDVTSTKVLIFNQQDRKEAVDFLDTMYKIIRDNKVHFSHVVFCTNVTKDPKTKDLVNHQADTENIQALTVQNNLASKWRQIDPTASISVAPTVNDALDIARELTSGLRDVEGVEVLVTGSLHLVGAVLSTME